MDLVFDGWPWMTSPPLSRHARTRSQSSQPGNPKDIDWYRGLDTDWLEIEKMKPLKENSRIKKTLICVFPVGSWWNTASPSGTPDDQINRPLLSKHLQVLLT